MKRCPQCGASYRGDPARCPLDNTALVQVEDSRVGAQIGGWTLSRLLSEHKLTTVYMAERGDERGALKLYRPLVPLQRIWREQASHQRFFHPHVAELLDHGVTPGGEGFLVTRFLEGETLRQRLDRQGAALPWRLALEIAAQAAEALVAIHARGIVHRDLKPENLMLAPRADEAVHVTLLDLGHALALDLARLTESGMVWGSAPYMSPEQVAGRGVDHRSDLYSLGIVLYEMLVGRQPFEAKSAGVVMEMHWRSPPPALVVDGLPAALGELYAWLLAKRPEQRPPNAHVVQAALRGGLAADSSPTMEGDGDAS